MRSWQCTERAGQRFGTEELQRSVAAGEVSAGARVWTPGMARWRPVSELPALVEHFEERSSPPPVPPADGSERPIRDVWKALRFPWTAGQDLKKLWWFVLVQAIPGVGWIVGRGWRLELMRRPWADPFPDTDRVVRALVNGLFLWGMFLLYMIPEMLFLALTGVSWIFDLLDLIGYVLGAVASGSPITGAGSMIAGSGVDFVLKSGFLVFYPILSWPFFRLAMMRYARENRPGVFLEFHRNWEIFREHHPLLMQLFLQAQLLLLATAALAGLAAVTVVGFVIIPFVVEPLRVIATGVLYKGAMEKIFGPLTTPTPGAVGQPGIGAGVGR